MMIDDPGAVAHTGAPLATELEWLRVQLNVHTRRVIRRDPSDAFAPLPPCDTAEAETLSRATAERASAHGAPSPLATLVTRFGLTADDYLILLHAAAGELGPDFPRVFAQLNQHSERPYPTLVLIMDAFYAPEDWARVRGRLGPEAPLRWHGLLHVSDEPVAPPLGLQRLVLDERVRAFVAGQRGLDPLLDPFADLALPEEAHGWPPLLLSDAVQPILARAKALVDGYRGRFAAQPLIILRGPVGSGRRRLAHQVAEHLGMGSLAADLTALALQPEGIEHGLRRVVREARLHRAMLCLRGWDTWAGGQLVPAGEEDEGFVQTTSDNLIRRGELLFETLLAGHDGPVALLVTDRDVHLPELRRGVERFEIGMPDTDIATRLWEAALPADRLTQSGVPRQLGVTFRLTPGQIEAAAQEGTRGATLDGSGLSFSAVQQVIKRQLRHRLGDIADLKTTRYKWDDLIVSPAVRVQMREIISRYRFKHKVMEEWRFGARFGTGVGLSALFEGPPGTGKTMAASIIAGELGLDLFQVDLSKVMSKYIGETEKQLATLFTEAENAGAIVLFDEADSLFSKRTEVKSSNDRYSNLKVNFLLQRIEQFSGIAILTTNFPENMDEAFGRRVTTRLQFVAPDAAARRRIWENMLGSEPICADDLDLDEIAKTFDMSGGHIKNAVMRAAYIAAARDALIDHDTLVLAARIELKQQGKLLMGDPLRDLADNYDL